MAKGGVAGTVGAVTRLVLGVARLGEVDLRGWWSSHGLDKIGQFRAQASVSPYVAVCCLGARCVVGSPQARKCAF